MNKKYISLLLLPVLLTGCSGSIKLEFKEYSSFVNKQELMRDEDKESYKCQKETSPVTYRDGTVNSLSDFMEDFKSGYKRESIPTTGDRKLLVVPISFTDSDKDSQEEKKIFLQNAFFGENNRTNYYSVAGYYNASSYGQLKITGEVAPWFNANMSASELDSMPGAYMARSSMVVNQAVDYYKANGLIPNLSDYDTDDDDDIDGVYAIYDHPYNDSKGKAELFWAYTHYTYKGEGLLNNDAPYVNGYSWTSIEAVMQKDNRSYTNYLIHETGHLFGLTDYYNTKSSSLENDYHFQPTGCFDVMDYNIGDHSSFSKYLFKWSSPMVVKKGTSGKIKLHPFTTSGEYLLVPSSSYNNSPFGEYLLVEFFAPNGLNKFNGAYSYVDKDGNSGVYRYPQHYGLRIYHVNAKLGYFGRGNIPQLICTVDDPEVESKIGSSTVGLDFAYSNTIKDSEVGTTPVLVHLLESSGKNTFKDGIPANNNTLFKVGDDFGINKFKDFTFSNGETTNFKLKVKDLSTRDITIEYSF
jgi:M6 family metalloprotease-like protein